MRNAPRTRIDSRADRRAGAPPALLLGLGLFLLTLLVVGALLFAGQGDGANDNSSGAVIASPTAAPSPTQQAAAADTPTPAVTPTATTVPPTATATETPAAPDPTATTIEPTATAAVTETPTEAPQPTPTQAGGAFGQLPPADIPSGGLSRSLNLTYQLDVSLDTAPSEADVYQLVWPSRTKAGVAALAGSLGIQGNVTEQGGGSFAVSGAGGSITIQPRTTQISLDAKPPTGKLEDDATLVDNARTWLLDHDLVAANIGDGAVTGKDGERATVVFTASDPSPLLAAYPSASVTLGPGGSIYEAYVKWPASYNVATYQLQSADDLWATVQSGQGYVEADLSGVPGSGPVSGTFVVSAISVAYSTAASADADYLAPIMVFSGEAQLGDAETSVPISIYVPAIAGATTPRG